MTLEERIVDWAATRPAWQHQVLVRLASGELLGSEDYIAIGRSLVAGEAFSTQPLSLSHIPGTGDLSLPVRLREVRRVAHVNALLPEQTLTFGLEGITVIYGDNGSGKSGYARLLKQVVRARHS